ncbi:hypothetical protein Tco_1122118 [Tanacetum coccineum]|uniref:Uncharacterized protein n=1 Tax=Tanacetum coccineum TaxID=301880 RepID=A0ABQ5J2L1_9ASTR
MNESSKQTDSTDRQIQADIKEIRTEETDIQEKDKNKAKNDKTEHENEKSVKRSQSQSQRYNTLSRPFSSHGSILLLLPCNSINTKDKPSPSPPLPPPSHVYLPCWQSHTLQVNPTMVMKSEEAHGCSRAKIEALIHLTQQTHSGFSLTKETQKEEEEKT